MGVKDICVTDGFWIEITKVRGHLSFCLHIIGTWGLGDSW
jgi:hypothetical protein